MTDTELNLAISKWRGFLVVPGAGLLTRGYCNDLNAMAEAEERLSVDQKTDYIRILNRGDFSYRRLAFATARQRAEALVKVIKEDA